MVIAKQVLTIRISLILLSGRNDFVFGKLTSRINSCHFAVLISRLQVQYSAIKLQHVKMIFLLKAKLTVSYYFLFEEGLSALPEEKKLLEFF